MAIDTNRLDLARDHMARNHWVASRRELISLGILEEQIDSWLRAGRLVSVLHGVYSYGRDIEVAGSPWRAALLTAGTGSALAGSSACELWGMIRSDGKVPARIQVASGRRNAIRFHGRSPAMSRTRVEAVRRTFEPEELRRRDGLVVTCPARALIDLAVVADPAGVRFAFLEACRLGLFGRRDVAYCFRRVAGRRGARKLSPLLALWVPELGRIRSVLEGLFLLAWVDGGNRRRMPLVNHRLCGHEVDCHWPQHRVVVELDGGAFHSDPLARTRDAAKDQLLRARGFTVVRFGYDAVNDTPERVVGEVAAILEAA